MGKPFRSSQWHKAKAYAGKVFGTKGNVPEVAMRYFSATNKELSMWREQRSQNYVCSEMMQRHQEFVRALEAMSK